MIDFVLVLIFKQKGKLRKIFGDKAWPLASIDGISWVGPLIFEAHKLSCKINTKINRVTYGYLP